MNDIIIQRGRLLNDRSPKTGPVIYWLSRDQRLNDNWALLAASEEALKRKEKLLVVFSLTNDYLGASFRQYDFMLKGLVELEEKFAKHNIPFHLISGNPSETILEFVKKYQASLLITDFSPLRLNRKWKNDIAQKLAIPFYEVDAHNIIPAWLASDKQEYGAYTIRPKINRLLDEFLVPFPVLKKQVKSTDRLYKNDFKQIFKDLNSRFTEAEKNYSSIFLPGEKEANRMMKDFLVNRLAKYDLQRNDPNLNGQSNLSPYLHFGQLSAQRLALEVEKSVAPKLAREIFLEELIIRRELSDNYCLYNENYDNPAGFPDWAKKTIKKHAKTKREYLYKPEEFELAKTHDNLWNAAQLELVKTAKMHGYLRMYWAKKILEWTSSVEEAMMIAIYLNDRYQLDGRDPNGYAGIAWSLGGVHDRAWFERPVFGQIRYMNENGCRRKFKVDEYIAKWL